MAPILMHIRRSQAMLSVSSARMKNNTLTVGKSDRNDWLLNW